VTKFSFPEPGAVVRDIEGRRYKLVAQLNDTGGQGVIYTTEDTNLLIKVRTPPRSRDSQDYRRQLLVLAQRNLKIDALVLPRAVLDEPYLGYIMDRVDHAIPLDELVYPKISSKTWHIETGGLRRRLQIAAELARTILQIHRNGLCYVDLSWKNVLIPSDSKRTLIKLIDPDNLSIPGTSLAEVIGSAGFIAPEILKEDRFPNHTSDRWSLAVAIFNLLVLNHPFFGDQVLEGEPELEDKAYLGELPYTDSKDNHQNRSSVGLPVGKVLTRKLRELSRQTFEAGVTDPHARPSPEEWLSALQEATDQTALCPHCRGTSYYLPEMRNSDLVCEWCGKTSPRPIELGFFPPDSTIEDLDDDERRELNRQRKLHRLVLDTGQRTLPTRLINSDPETIGDVALFGTKLTSQNEKVCGLENRSQDHWETEDTAGGKQTIAPGERVWLSDKTIILFSSGIRAMVRNPYRGGKV